MNDFSSKCDILGELWFSYREDEAFTDFIEYNDIGLPLAYLVSQKLAKPEPQGEIYINETWDLFLEALDCDPNLEYADLDDLLDNANDRGLDEGTA